MFKRRKSRDLEALRKRAVNLCLTDLPEETEASIASGPGMVLGAEAAKAMPSGAQVLALSSCRVGFMIRLAELELVPNANDRDFPGWGAVAEVTLRMFDRYPDAEPAVSTIAAAEFFASEPAMTRILFESVPGLGPEARSELFEATLALIAADNPPDGQDRLQVYGFALGVVRETVLVAHERSDAEREGRPPVV
jgi:hypothetical protein